MNVEPWQREFDIALGAVRDAATLARHIRRQIGEQGFLKVDRSPVTVADFAVQALVGHRLQQAFPGDPLVAEEDSALLRTPEARPILESVLDVVHRVAPDLASDQVVEAIDHGRGEPSDRFWTLDPVDGTQGFVRGDQYVVALALVVRGRVEIGLLGCPQLTLTDEPRAVDGTVACAIRNRGAFRTTLIEGEFTALRVSSRSDPRLARVLRSFEGEHIDLSLFDQTIRTMRVEVAPTLMDSQAKHVMIAAGQADLMIRLPATQAFRDKIWDQAAGSLLIEEAGGRVTDMRGAALNFGVGRVLAGNEGVIASNGHLHGAVLDALRTVTGWS
jgi:3'(2'), 5'-bisphosphate nucleotidase